ncbi:MAG: hypothetical protein JJ900_16875 [Rhodospirillales bacterium]|nr:hypothetical protein [Rhodospirillales bacterium]MBO6788523.1 hypothetical protein [Rhodospirillales bacterium]
MLRRIVVLLIAVIGFPVCGLLIGYGYFVVFEFLNGPLPDAVLEVFLILWGGFGVAVACYCVWDTVQTELDLRRLKARDAVPDQDSDRNK